MTFEDETNAKLPAISCFIKLGDKYIKHKNNNNKNKKTCICASSICFLGIVSLFLVHQAIGYLKVKLNNLILEIWSLYDQSCPEWTLFKALEALVLAGGGVLLVGSSQTSFLVICFQNPTHPSTNLAHHKIPNLNSYQMANSDSALLKCFV